MTDLLERVRARAAAIRASWESSEDDLDELAQAEEELDSPQSAALDDAPAQAIETESGIGGSQAPPTTAASASGPTSDWHSASSDRASAVDSRGAMPSQDGRDHLLAAPVDRGAEAPAGVEDRELPRRPDIGAALAAARVPERSGDRPLLQPYIPWQPTRRINDPRTAQQQDLIDAILEVVGVEGPVVGWRVYRLINRAAGGQRLAKHATRALNRAAAAAIRRGLIVESNPLGQPGQAHLVLRVPDAPAVVLRERGPRDLDEMPPDEIAALARRLREQVPTASLEELKRKLLETYGWQRLTPNVSATLDRCLALQGPD